MNSNSNALTLLGLDYESESDSCHENESKLCEDNCSTNTDNNQNKSEEEINRSVGLTLNQLIERVCDDLSLNHKKHSNNISYNSNSFSTTRPVKSEAEIDISSSSSSSSWSLSSDDSSDEELMETNKSYMKNDGKNRGFVKTRGELGINELPPIENLSIRVNVEELTQIGRVFAIVDQLVIVQSFRSMPALDLDSVLFLKDGSPLGSVFDLFGPVVEPRYAVRFNDNHQIVDRNITPETPVYFAANYQKPVTGYVFAEQLRQLKGSDASWKHNNEPPEDVKEFSDDETERLQKQKERAKGRRRNRHNHNYNRNHNQNNTRSGPSGIVVPPNTPNSPFNQYYLNQYQQHPHQLSQPQYNWFANTYQ